MTGTLPAVESDVDEDVPLCAVCGGDMCPGCRSGLGRARAGLLGLSILALGLAVGRFVPVPFSGADAGSSPNSIDREPAVTVPAPATEPSSEGRSGAASPAMAPQRIATSVPEAVGPLDHPLLSTRPAALWFWQPSCLDCGLQARDAVAWAMQWSTSRARRPGDSCSQTARFARSTALRKRTSCRRNCGHLPGLPHWQPSIHGPSPTFGLLLRWSLGVRRRHSVGLAR